MVHLFPLTSGEHYSYEMGAVGGLAQLFLGVFVRFRDSKVSWYDATFCCGGKVDEAALESVNRSSIVVMVVYYVNISVGLAVDFAMPRWHGINGVF